MSSFAEAHIDIIVQAAKKFYLDNLSQVEIAQQLGISRPTVSRLLKKAVDTGIVDIHINDFSYVLLDMAAQIEQFYGLQKVIVVKGNENSLPSVKAEAARAAADYFTEILEDQNFVGMSHGTTIYTLLNYIRPVASKSINAVQLQGNSAMNVPYVQGTYMVVELARILGGIAYPMHAPLSVRSRTLHDLLLEEPYMKNHFDLFRKLDIALVGIGTGTLDYNDNTMYIGAAPENAVSNICNLYFDKDGNALDTDYHRHAIGIPYEDLRAIPNVIAVAVGTEKKEAVLSALKSKLINTLVIDEYIANHILANAKSS